MEVEDEGAREDKLKQLNQLVGMLSFPPQPLMRTSPYHLWYACTLKSCNNNDEEVITHSNLVPNNNIPWLATAQKKIIKDHSSIWQFSLASKLTHIFLHFSHLYAATCLCVRLWTHWWMPPPTSVMWWACRQGIGWRGRQREGWRTIMCSLSQDHQVHYCNHTVESTNLKAYI